MKTNVSIALALLSSAVLACCILQAAAFSPSTIGLGNVFESSRVSTCRQAKLVGITMNAETATAKPGTGANRMTPTGFTVPFVEKVVVPSSAGFEWKVKTDVLDAKKINMQEKVKLAKPGLSIIDELEKLAAEAKEKGGAQVPHNHRPC